MSNSQGSRKRPALSASSPATPMHSSLLEDEPPTRRSRRDILSCELETIQAELEHERSLRALDLIRFVETKQRLEKQCAFAAEEVKESKALLEEIREENESILDQLRGTKDQLRRTMDRTKAELRDVRVDLDEERALASRQGQTIDDLRESMKLMLEEHQNSVDRQLQQQSSGAGDAFSEARPEVLKEMNRPQPANVPARPLAAPPNPGNPNNPAIQRAPIINPNMHVPPPALGAHLPTPIIIHNIPATAFCSTYNIPLRRSDLKKLHLVWKSTNRVHTLPSLFPPWTHPISAPVLVAAKAAWLLNANTATIKACLANNAIPFYTSRHERKPEAYTYPDLNTALPPGFHCQPTPPHLSINQLLKPFHTQPELVYHGLPWYTYPIVAELAVPAHKSELKLGVFHITGYAIFQHQCRAIIAVNQHPGYTLIGTNLLDENDLGLLACKIFPINNNRNKNKRAGLRILTTFVVTPITVAPTTPSETVGDHTTPPHS